MSHRHVSRMVAVITVGVVLTLGFSSPAFSSASDALGLDLKFPWPASRNGCVKLNVGYENPYHTGWQEYGLDFNLVNEPVAAAFGGTVIISNYDKISGNQIVVQFGEIRGLYGHLSKRDVKEGDLVQQGEIIGRSGQTGKADGPHLHFHLYTGSRSNKQPVKPEPISGITGLTTGRCYVSENATPTPIERLQAQIENLLAQVYQRALDQIPHFGGYCVGLDLRLGRNNFPFTTSVLRPKDGPKTDCSSDLSQEREENLIFETSSGNIRLNFVWWIIRASR